MPANKGRIVRVSKFLSLVLRHRPEKIGLVLDAGGWADVEALLDGARRAGVRLDRALLDQVVAQNDKQRFALSADGQKIRANQGHSISVDLGLEPLKPPQRLFHGTARRFLPSIWEKGLLPRGRQHVHLSPDETTARRVGRRHGQPVVLQVRARPMQRDGHVFYLSANRVWLTSEVPPHYLFLPAVESEF